MDNERKALVVFAKEPVLGKVKTRLSKDVPAEVVLELYKAFVEDVIKAVDPVDADKRFLYYACDNDNPVFLNQFAGTFELKRQSDGDLGARLYAAFEQCHRQDFKRCVIIGTDCLTLDHQDIDEAFAQLKSNDYVLGPSADGGYYMIGARAPQREIFADISWSSDCVFDQTMDKIKRLKKNVYLTRTKEDIDDLEALERFIVSDNEKNRGQKCRQLAEKFLEKD